MLLNVLGGGGVLNVRGGGVLNVRGAGVLNVRDGGAAVVGEVMNSPKSSSSSMMATGEICFPRLFVFGGVGGGGGVSVPVRRVLPLCCSPEKPSLGGVALAAEWKLEAPNPATGRGGAPMPIPVRWIPPFWYSPENAPLGGVVLAAEWEGAPNPVITDLGVEDWLGDADAKSPKSSSSSSSSLSPPPSMSSKSGGGVGVENPP